MQHIVRNATISISVIVLIASLYLPGMTHAVVGKVPLNTSGDREWTVHGVLEFTVIGGSSTVGGVPVGPGVRLRL